MPAASLCCQFVTAVFSLPPCELQVDMPATTRVALPIYSYTQLMRPSSSLHCVIHIHPSTHPHTCLKCHPNPLLLPARPTPPPLKPTILGGMAQAAAPCLARGQTAAPGTQTPWGPCLCAAYLHTNSRSLKKSGSRCVMLLSVLFSRIAFMAVPGVEPGDVQANALAAQVKLHSIRVQCTSL